MADNMFNVESSGFDPVWNSIFLGQIYYDMFIYLR